MINATTKILIFFIATLYGIVKLTSAKRKIPNSMFTPHAPNGFWAMVRHGYCQVNSNFGKTSTKSGKLSGILVCFSYETSHFEPNLGLNIGESGENFNAKS